MTHLDDLHALLSERAHLRAQRDELQRDCTRFEAEARAAREELRNMRAATFDPKKSFERIFVENRTLLAELAKAEQDEREAELAINPPRQRFSSGRGALLGGTGRAGGRYAQRARIGSPSSMSPVSTMAAPAFTWARCGAGLHQSSKTHSVASPSPRRISAGG